MCEKMRFRTLTGAQRHRLTNALFVAGVVSAVGTVTGTSILGCPAVNRQGRLDDQIEVSAEDQPSVSPKQGLQEKQYIGGQLQSVATQKSKKYNSSIDTT
ncbi:hypothetical protein IW150_005284 [Coemansia sp. RSA 2607]|nr:hypothetical protein IW150_005284 [Coemansia sp. RSA 2607]